MRKDVKGIFVSMLTPFKKGDLKVDFDALMDLVGFISDHSANGIIPLSSYGEFDSLSINEKKEIMVSIMEAREDLTVMPNVGTDNYAETIDLIHYAQGIGVDALLLIPPYFYKDIDIKSLTTYFKKIIEVIDIPVYLYNIPKYSGIEISDLLIENLMETGKISGIKDASGDISRVQHLHKKYPDLNIILANDNLFYEGLLSGINTFSSYLFNAFPEVVKAVGFDFRQPQKGGKAAQQYLNELYHIIKNYTEIPVLKYATTLRGIEENEVRPPFSGLSNEQKDILKKVLLPYIKNPNLVD